MTEQKKPVVMVRKVKTTDQDRSFDLEFWGRVGVQGKFAAAWEMVCDLAKWKPGYAKQQGLRRSIATLQRRRS